jgi:hypothetical protein
VVEWVGVSAVRGLHTAILAHSGRKRRPTAHIGLGLNGRTLPVVPLAGQPAPRRVRRAAPAGISRFCSWP